MHNAGNKQAQQTVQFEKHSRRILLSGVIALTLSNVLVKVMGMLFKIPLTNLIGEEGMAYYNLSYNIFKWFYMISTAGLPVAISIQIARSRAKRREVQVRHTDKIALQLFFTVGIVCTAAMLFLSGVFANLQGAPMARYCMVAIAPSLLFICISSCLRGYFQGFGSMGQTAVSQLIEAGCKLFLGMLFAWYSMFCRKDPLYLTAAFAILGSTVGTFLAMLYMWAAKRFFRPTYDSALSLDLSPGRGAQIVRCLLRIALPITVSASVMSLTDLIDSVLVINCLTGAGGVEPATALRLYGNYTSLAVPMYNLPLALIYPLCSAMVPAMSAAHGVANGEKLGRILQRTFQTAALIAIPATIGLSVLARPILALLYRSSLAETGAPMLSILSMSVFFVAMVSVSNAALQATGHERLPILSMLIGAAVKLISNYLLTSIPAIGILGAPISTCACYLSIMLLNLWFTVRHTGVCLSVTSVFLKPFIAAAASVAAALGCYGFLLRRFSDSLACLSAIAFAVPVYLLVLHITGDVDFRALLTQFRTARNKSVN